MDRAVDGGFDEPVLDSQRSFRAVMNAFAHPGSRHSLARLGSVPDALADGLGSVMLTLVDVDTPIWLGEGLRRDEAVNAFIRFHTGAPIVDDPQAAVFAFAADAGELPALDQFNLGSQEYPDRSTMIVLGVAALDGGIEMTIRGPGIKDHGEIAPRDLADDFVSQWHVNRELFPRGVDILLVAGNAVLGLPRSTRIAEGH